MGKSVKRQIKVLRAEYVDEADSILLVGECEEGKLRHQINSSCFTFGNRDKETEMKKTAEMMIGKKIWIVFDPDLVDKISDGNSLEY
jgi:hypothetical protein